MQSVGFFPYYREEKTKAYFMKHQVPNFVKKHRLKVVQKIQKKIADANNMSRLGQVVQAIVDKFDENTGFYVGRDQFSSPTVDFEILIKDNNSVQIGNIYNVKLVDYINLDFVGEIV